MYVGTILLIEILKMRHCRYIIKIAIIIHSNLGAWFKIELLLIVYRYKYGYVSNVIQCLK